MIRSVFSRISLCLHMHIHKNQLCYGEKHHHILQYILLHLHTYTYIKHYTVNLNCLIGDIIKIMQLSSRSNLIHANITHEGIKILCINNMICFKTMFVVKHDISLFDLT